jgi:magnesium chelatase family protein
LGHLAPENDVTRLPSILPPMTLREALETTKIHSVAGKEVSG